MKVLNILVCLLLIACVDLKNEIPERNLKNSRGSINMLSDSTFLGRINSISYYKDNLYLSDFNRNQVLILDRDLNLLTSMGASGKGPGEFIGIGRSYISKDTIFIESKGKRAIELFSLKGDHLNTIYFKNKMFNKGSNRFFVNEQELFLSSPNTDKMTNIIKYNLESDDYSSFGELKKYRNDPETSIKNNKHLLKYNNYIITIAENRPEISLYDEKGNLINAFDYGSLKFLEDTMEFSKKSNERINSFFQIVPDACIYENNIYILLNLRDNATKKLKNKILKIVLEQNEFKLDYTYNFDRGLLFSNLSVNDNILMLFNILNNSLYEYKIPY